jgi:group I intron endonuclease
MKSFKGIIYKTTNLINGKIYVGQDKNCNPNYKGSGILLHRAISKYGWDNFVKEILEVCHSKEELNDREKFWIKELDARDKTVGYNISAGGSGGDTISSHPDKRRIIAKTKFTARTVVGNDGLTSNQRRSRKVKTVLASNGLTIAKAGGQVAAKTAKTKMSSVDSLTVAQNRSRTAAKTRTSTILDNGLTIAQDLSKRSAITMQTTILDNGLTIAQDIGLQVISTLSSKIDTETGLTKLKLRGVNTAVSNLTKSQIRKGLSKDVAEKLSIEYRRLAISRARTKQLYVDYRRSSSFCYTDVELINLSKHDVGYVNGHVNKVRKRLANDSELTDDKIEQLCSEARYRCTMKIKENRFYEQWLKTINNNDNSA